MSGRQPRPIQANKVPYSRNRNVANPLIDASAVYEVKLQTPSNDLVVTWVTPAAAVTSNLIEFSLRVNYHGDASQEDGVGGTYLSLILFCGLLAGCASNQAATQVQQGRAALLIGEPASALIHFNQAAQENPNYVSDFSPLRQGVLTYVGRSYYALGNLPEARKALTQSVERDQSDFMARLFLGLTLLRLPRTPARAGNTLSVADITFALKERVSPTRIAALIKERGVNFAFTGDIERELRKLGADNYLIEQVRTSARARKIVEPDPSLQGVRETDRALRETRKWLDEISQTPSGRFWDPAKNIRSEIGKNLAMIASKKPNLSQLISGGEWVGKAMEEEIDLVRRDEREQPSAQRR